MNHDASQPSTSLTISPTGIVTSAQRVLLPPGSLPPTREQAVEEYWAATRAAAGITVRVKRNGSTVRLMAPALPVTLLRLHEEHPRPGELVRYAVAGGALCAHPPAPPSKPRMGRREAVPALEGAPVSDLPESADEPPDRGHLVIRLASDTKGTALEVALEGYRLRGGATSAMRLFTRSFQGRMHQRAGVRFLQGVVQRLREKSNRDA